MNGRDTDMKINEISEKNNTIIIIFQVAITPETMIQRHVQIG